MIERTAAALTITLALGILPAAAASPAPPAAAPKVVLKIASIAPERSPWGKALEKVAADWERLSNGAVQVKIFAGSIAGGEQDVIRKIRLGVLQGGVFSNMGLAKIDPSLTVLSIPFLFHSREEFNAVFERMKPVLENKIEAKGFQVVQWTLAGWVNFFTKGQVLAPDDLKKFKMSVTADFPELEQVWKRMGYEVVTGEESTLLIQLQSGAASGAYLSPLFAASGQYFPLIPHMFGPSLAPLIGGLVLGDRAWAAIPAELHQPFLDVVAAAAQGLYDETMAIEADAIKMMKENGLVVHDAPPDKLAQWYDAAGRAVDKLLGPVFSKELYDQVIGYVQEFRKSRGQ